MKRDSRALKHDGYFVMTRGAKHDMGPGLSHKTQILELYFKDTPSPRLSKRRTTPNAPSPAT